MPAEMGYELPNVEPPSFDVLGSIPVEGDGLLANLDMKPLGDGADGRVFLGPQGLDLPPALPPLGNPIPGLGPQTLPTSE